MPAFQRNYTTEGIDGEQLEVFESEFVLDAQNRIARFRVMGNQTRTRTGNQRLRAAPADLSRRCSASA